MVGNAVRVGVMSALALVGGMQVVSSIPLCVTSDPRVLTLEAQWKMATGDAEGAYKVIRRSDAHRATVPVNHTAQVRGNHDRSGSSRS